MSSTLHTRLAPWIGNMWCSGPEAGPPTVPRAARTERLLPTGQCRLIVRLSDEGLWVAGGGGLHFGTVSPAALVGAHDRHVLRRSIALSASVGVTLRPGATLALFGLPASSITGQYVDLREVCGADADRLVERIRSTRSVPGRLAMMRDWLATRIDSVRVGLPPGWPARLERLLQTPGDRDDGLLRIRRVADHVGWSQKRLVACWRNLAGLAPKQQQRIARFNRLLSLAGEHEHSWAERAAICGYSDQAHLGRDFVDLAGLTPGQWQARRPLHPLHVPEMAPPASGDFLQDGMPIVVM